jgi:chromosome segregation ATPase
MNIEELAFKNYYELINIQKIDLLLIIEFLQKDRKQWINQFTQTHNESIDIRKENQELKSKLELYENGVYFSSEVDEKDKQIDKLKKKYENAVADYEKIEFEKEQLNSLVNSCQEEIRQLKKQLEEKENIACNWENSCLENAGKIEILEIQQKEFINYLEDEKNRLARGCSNICEDKFDEVNDILQKYKEIIGDDK